MVSGRCGILSLGRNDWSLGDVVRNNQKTIYEVHEKPYKCMLDLVNNVIATFMCNIGWKRKAKEKLEGAKEEMNEKRKLIQRQFAEMNEMNGQVHLLMKVITC